MAAPSPALAALLATFVPGGGQLYLDQPVEAAATAGTEAALLTTAILVEPEPSNEFRLTPRVLAVQLWSQVHTYSIYAAYRDARLRLPVSRRRGEMGSQTLDEMLTAPFSEHALSPEVALPVASLAALFVGIALTGRRTLFDVADVEMVGTSLSPAAAFAAQTPVHGVLSMGAAVSEEALFRGMVQSGMMEWWSPQGAIAGQAILFGVSHFPNAFLLDSGRDAWTRAGTQVALTSALGGWMGYLTHLDGGDLRRAVAFHFWYDFMVMTIGFVAAPRDSPLRLSMSLPF